MAKTNVYIIQSIANPNRFYTGLTSNVEARLKKHNHGGCSFTKQHRPWKVRTVFMFDDEARARAFERYLKSGSGREFAKKRF